MAHKKQKRGLIVAIGGTVVVALCCFTPILVILFGALGLSVVVPYLDFLLLPALAAMIILTWFAFQKYRKSH